MLHLPLALANVGNKFPTWEEILAIVALDALLIVGAFFMIRRSLRRSRGVSGSEAGTPQRPPSGNPSLPGAIPARLDEVENDH